MGCSSAKPKTDIYTQLKHDVVIAKTDKINKLFSSAGEVLSEAEKIRAEFSVPYYEAMTATGAIYTTKNSVRDIFDAANLVCAAKIKGFNVKDKVKVAKSEPYFKLEEVQPHNLPDGVQRAMRAFIETSIKIESRVQNCNKKFIELGKKLKPADVTKAIKDSGIKGKPGLDEARSQVKTNTSTVEKSHNAIKSINTIILELKKVISGYKEDFGNLKKRFDAVFEHFKTFKSTLEVQHVITKFKPPVREKKSLGALKQSIEANKRAAGGSSVAASSAAAEPKREEPKVEKKEEPKEQPKEEKKPASIFGNLLGDAEAKKAVFNVLYKKIIPKAQETKGLNTFDISLKQSVPSPTEAKTTAVVARIDHNQFLRGTDAGTVHLHSASNIEEEIKSFETNQTAAVAQLIDLTDGVTYAARFENGVIAFIDVESEDAPVKVLRKESEGPLVDMQFGTSGEELYLASADKVTKWNFVSKKSVEFDPKGTVTKILVDGETETLIVGKEDGSLVGFSKEGNEIEFEQQASSAITSLVAVKLNGERAVAIGAKEKCIFINAIDSGLKLKSISPVKGDNTVTLLYLHDERNLVHANDSGYLNVINYAKASENLKKNNTRKFFCNNHEHVCATYMGDGSSIILINDVGNIDLWKKNQKPI